MSGTFKSLQGKRYGRLTVLKATEHRTKQGAVMWECRCDCGNVVLVCTHSLKSGNTKSCGCLHKQRITKHRRCDTRLYRIWANMKYRCNNPRAAKYQYYGGKGIRVCDEWENDFSAFYDWAVKNGYAFSLSLDRIDGNGNYEPKNCRWANSVEQNNNRNICKKKRHKSFSEAMAENIYCGMKMENRAVTFPQTKTILEGVNVPNVQLNDIQAILNMRDAWRHILSDIQAPVTLEYVCGLNGYIARNEALEWGKLRTGRVAISGTDYMPPIPQEEEVRKELQAMLDMPTSATEKALCAFVWGTRAQLFWDGNKRTSLTLANKILLAAGAGMLTISEKHMEQFNALLLAYYDTGEAEELKAFLYDTAIQGIELGGSV